MSNQIAKLKRAWPLWTLLAVFFLPMVIAGYVRNNVDSLAFHTTQNGQFPDQIFTLEVDKPTDFNGNLVSASELDSHWTLIYVRPESCGEACEKVKADLHNLYTALGRDQVKLEILVVPQASLKSMNIRLEDVSLLTTGHFLVANTKHEVILTYRPDTDLYGVLKDVRKLLKNSRIM